MDPSQKSKRKRKLKSPQIRSQIGSQLSETFDDEEVFWDNQFKKLSKALQILKHQGTPYLKVSTNPVPQTIKHMIQSRNQTLLPLIISGFIEGRPRTPLFKLSLIIENYFKEFGWFINDFEGLMKLLESMTECKDYSSNETFNITEVFSSLNMSIPNELPVELVTGQNQVFIVNDPTKLAYWMPVQYVYALRHLRSFIKQIQPLIQDILPQIKAKKYEEAGQTFIKIYQLKKEWNHITIPDLDSYSSDISQFYKDPHSIFYTMDEKPLMSTDFQEKVFEESLITDQPFRVISDIPITKSSESPIKQRRKYLQLHDSLKELRGCTFKKTYDMNPRQPLRKYDFINYEVDSEDEIHELTAEGCESDINSISSVESYYSEEADFIVQEEKDKHLYNKQIFSQLTSGAYQLETLFQTQQNIEQFLPFQIYNITDEPFPIKNTNKIQDQRKSVMKKKEFLLDPDNVVAMLMFTHGQKYSKDLCSNFIINFPQCTKKLYKDNLDQYFFRNDDKILFIKQEYIERYNLQNRLAFIHQNIAVSPFPSGGSNLLTGNYRFTPKKQI